MKQLMPLFFLLAAVFYSSSLWAVDESKIWLPKKYQHIKPKLLAAAKQAEASKRCVKVVSGEMISRRNTATHYYFVITCRDENRKSYNISYNHPIEGGKAELVNEQRVWQGGAGGRDVEKMNRLQRVQLLCEEEIQVEALLLGKVTLHSDQLKQVEIEDSTDIRLDIPITVKNPFGTVLGFTALCSVDHRDNIEVGFSIDPKSIFDLCINELQRKAKKMIDFALLDQALPELQGNNDEGYLAVVPFNAKDPSGRKLSYNGECHVKEDGRSSIKMRPRRKSS